MKKLRITVEGKTYDVEVEILGDEPGTSVPPASPNVTRSVDIGSAPSSTPSSSASAPAPAGAVVSPLTGRVVEVNVSAGQSVKEGDTLLTVEAMKMNTFVYAPRAGSVSNVLVNAGDSVEEGQALVTID